MREGKNQSDGSATDTAHGGGSMVQHYVHAIGSIKDSVGNVRNLSSGRSRVVGHGLEHLGRDNDGLAGNVALGD